MKKLLIIALAVASTLSINAQSYSLQDIASSIKIFGSHVVYLEKHKVLAGSYDSVHLDRSYITINLQGELRLDSLRSGSLRQVIAFDARDISNDVMVVSHEIGGNKDRWDVILKTKRNLDLIHFRNQQTNNYGVNVINEQLDVNKINIMFASADAANRFRNIAKTVFK
ncbi:MAG: hypothetical protein ABIO04_00505 [Ferruginibacter sp.]